MENTDGAKVLFAIREFAFEASFTPTSSNLAHIYAVEISVDKKHQSYTHLYQNSNNF